VFNIQKAVSRLPFAPKLEEIKITDIKKGLGVFTPKPDKAVSLEALKVSLKKAGYTLDSADITVTGTLQTEGERLLLLVASSQQRFQFERTNDTSLNSGDKLEVTGEWKAAAAGSSGAEVISVRSLKSVESKAGTEFEPTLRFMRVSFTSTSPDVVEAAKPLAPIRTTSPGLTVYKGGAITPRFYFIKQHLGDLEVRRQVLNVSASYTPSPRVQLEAEIPLTRSSFDDSTKSGSNTGLGNVVLWSKYRFYRTVKTYGDRQASARFGLELPTGNKTAPSAQSINAPAFVRQQLTAINGGLSPHLDLAFSQAGGRVIFGGNVEGIVRSDRDGFRLGHEVRVNTDFEYVLLPREYEHPGGELFLILETTFVHRGRGRLNSLPVEGSKSTEFYLSPGLQFAARPRFVVEGSVQIPVIRNTGPLLLKTDINVLAGIRYLF